MDGGKLMELANSTFPEKAINNSIASFYVDKVWDSNYPGMIMDGMYKTKDGKGSVFQCCLTGEKKTVIFAAWHFKAASTDIGGDYNDRHAIYLNISRSIKIKE